MEKVFDNSRVSDCTIMIKLAIANKIITVSSCHTPKVGLNAIKDALYDQLQDTVRKTGADKTLAICSDLNGHNGLFKSHGLRNKEGEDILEFSAPLNLVVGNSHFTKKDNHLITSLVVLVVR